MKKWIWTIGRIAIAAILLYFIFSKVGIANVWDVLKNIKIGYLLLAVAFLIINWFFNILNLETLIEYAGKPIGFIRTIKYYVVLWTFGLILPGLFGQLSIVYFLKKGEKMNYSQTSAIAFLDKLWGIIVVLSVCAIGSLFFLRKYFWIFTLLGIGIIISFVFILSNIQDLIPIKFINKIFGKIKEFLNILREYVKQPKYIFNNLVYSYLRWLVKGLFIMALFMSVGVSISYGVILFVISIEIILGSIPISISGLGLREGTGLLLYPMLAGTNTEIILAMYTIHLLLIYSIGLIGLLFVGGIKNEIEQA